MELVKLRNPAKMSWVIVFVFLALIIVSTAVSATSENVSSEKRVGYMGRPGVVMIVTEMTGQFENGNTGETEISLEYEGEEYVWPLPELSLASQGSGFVVSSSGYIVTNAHVVDMDEEMIEQYFAATTAADLVEKWKNYATENSIEASFSESDLLLYFYLTLLSDEYNLNYKKEIMVYFGGSSDNPPKRISADLRYSSPEQFWTSADPSNPSKVIKHRSGKDLAVIKISGYNNLPMVTLGNSDVMGIGEKVIVIGYPGVAGSSGLYVLSAESDYVPTVTSGIVSARKKLPDGSDILQTDAAIYHGNSGGPAFNEAGEVIGIATYASVDQLDSGQAINVQGFNFLIPINEAKDIIRELNIDTTPSPITMSFESGLESYWNGQYPDAMSAFNSIQSVDPTNYASEYYRMSAQM